MAKLSVDRQIKAAGPGRHTVTAAPGLQLVVLPSGGRSWILRVQAGGKRRDLGLGPYPATSLAAARERALELRREVKAGERPAVAKPAPPMTLTEAVAAYVDVHRSGWSNAKHATQWSGAIEKHVLPAIGGALVGDLTAGMIQDALLPSWRSCHVTSTRIRQRLEAVIAFADIREGRDRANPAQWRHRLSHLMPAPKAIRKAKPKAPHRALPWADAPRLHRALTEDGGSVARALLFALHTAARTGEVVHAVWSEINDDTLTWSIPGWRMKARRPHLVALSPAAMDALGKPRAGIAPLFPSPASLHQPLSETSLRRWLVRNGWPSTAHGLRSTFRDWVGETTSFPSELAEHALAHTVGNSTERSYARSTLLEPRRPLMAAWSAYLLGADAGDKVVPFKQHRG